MRIRPATPADLPACRDVCLGTGDSGADGRALFTLMDIVSDVFVAPYFEFCLEFAWVLENDEGSVCGYVLGCADTPAYETQLRDIWWPRMRAKYAGVSGVTDRDKSYLDFIATPVSAPAVVVAQFPAHGHIDLLPEAQGAGWGTKMMTLMMNALRDAGARGMYLDVSVDNIRAQKFYSTLGFSELQRTEESCYLGHTF